MFRRIALMTLLCLCSTLFAHAQETRPASRPTSKPTSKPTKALAAKKWVDEMATPIKIGKKGDWAEYGSPIKMKAQTSLKAIANAPTNFKDKVVLLRGTISKICTKKGCWLRMRDQGEEIFVKFKDYAFFAPRNLSGHNVLLEGKVTFETVKEAERRHMAEDAGKSPEEIAKIKGDEKEIRMMAHAMRIMEPQASRNAQMVMIGEHDNTQRLYSLEKIVADSKAYLGKEIDVAGQLVAVNANSFVIESNGKRLSLRFTNPRPDLKLIVLLKASSRPAFVRAHGKLIEKEGKRELAVMTASVVY